MVRCPSIELYLISQEIPQFFLPTAKIVWNGNPLKADAASMTAFLEAMPLSRHDCQTLDCHPLKGKLT